MQPAIVIPDLQGFHNDNTDAAQERMHGGRFRDFSTVCISPAIKPVPPRVVHAWMNMRKPPNTMYLHIMAEGMEVGQAYSHAVDTILRHEKLSEAKYILTLETDNAPPMNGLVDLLFALDDHPEYCAMSGLYWTKGEGGVPQCWGHPDTPGNFYPWIPPKKSIVQCNGIGMGFALWRTELFRDVRIEQPWFETTINDGETQDINFANKIGPLGYKIAMNTNVLVGHWDEETRRMW